MNRNSLFVHTVSVLLNRLSLPLGAFFLLVFIGRISNSLLGEYALVTTYFYIMQTLPLLGLTPFVMREVARDPGKSSAFLTSISLLCLFTSIFIFIAFQWGLGFADYEPHVKEAIRIAGYTIVPGILVFTAELILTSQHKTSPISVIAILENVLRVVLSIVLLNLGFGLVALIWVLFITRTLSLLTYVLLLRKVSDHRLLQAPDLAILKLALKVSPPFLLTMVLTLIMSRLDFIVLSLFQPLEVIGLYAVAYRTYEIGILLVSALLTAIFPTLATRYLNAPKHLATMIKSFLIIVLTLLIPVTVCGLFIVEHYVNILFPNQYPQAVLLTQLFMLLFFVGALDLSSSTVLNAIDAQKQDVKATILGATLYTTGLFLLVVPWGIYGAFIASVIAISVQFSAKLWLLSRRLPITMPRLEFTKWLVIVLISLSGAYAWINESVGGQIVYVLIFTTLILPALLRFSGLIQPMRLIRYFRKPEHPCEPGSLVELLDLVIADQRRRDSCHKVWGDMGQSAVLLCRIARYFYYKGFQRIAYVIHILNLTITKADIRPNVAIGSGLVILSSVGVVISSPVGRNATFNAWAAVGNSGNRDIGAGPGVPIIGNNIYFEHGAQILGAHEIPDRLVLKAAVKIRSGKDRAMALSA